MNIGRDELYGRHTFDHAMQVEKIYRECSAQRAEKQKNGCLGSCCEKPVLKVKWSKKESCLPPVRPDGQIIFVWSYLDKEESLTGLPDNFPISQGSISWESLKKINKIAFQK